MHVRGIPVEKMYYPVFVAGVFLYLFFRINVETSYDFLVITSFFVGYLSWLSGWVLSGYLFPTPFTSEQREMLHLLKVVKGKAPPKKSGGFDWNYEPRWLSVLNSIFFRNSLAIAFMVMVWLMFLSYH